MFAEVPPGGGKFAIRFLFWAKTTLNPECTSSAWFPISKSRSETRFRSYDAILVSLVSASPYTSKLAFSNKPIGRMIDSCKIYWVIQGHC